MSASASTPAARRFGIVLEREPPGSSTPTSARRSPGHPQGQVTAAGLLPRLKRFTVVGLFEVGMYEYDSGLALLHIEDAALLYQMPGQVSGLRLKLTDIYAAPAFGQDLRDRLGPEFRVRDWTREHANFFRALKIEKRVMLIILLLIVAVAAFNMVSSLVMLVTDKQADIAILRTWA